MKLVRRVALLSLLATPVQATSPMQPDSSPPSLCTSLLLSLADGRLQPDGSSSSRSASATCLGGSRRVARRFRRSAIAAAACRCLPRRFPTCPSISSGAPLEGLGSNPGVEDHLLGHGDHRRHRDRRHRDRRHRRTAAAPPHCWGASCAVPFFSLCILDEILVVPSHEIVGQVSINPNSRSRAPLPSFSCWADQDPSRGCSRRENPIPRAHSASWQLDSHPDFCAPFRRDAFKALDIFVAWDPCRAPG